MFCTLVKDSATDHDQDPECKKKADGVDGVSEDP